MKKTVTVYNDGSSADWKLGLGAFEACIMCADIAQDYFDIKDSDRELFIVLSDKPTKDAYKLEIIDLIIMTTKMCLDDKYTEDIYMHAEEIVEKFLRKINQKHCYVSIKGWDCHENDIL